MKDLTKYIMSEFRKEAINEAKKIDTSKFSSIEKPKEIANGFRHDLEIGLTQAKAIFPKFKSYSNSNGNELYINIKPSKDEDIKKLDKDLKLMKEWYDFDFKYVDLAKGDILVNEFPLDAGYGGLYVYNISKVQNESTKLNDDTDEFINITTNFL